MERIRLTRNEKKVLRLLQMEAGCPSTFPKSDYVRAVRSLTRKGLAFAHWAAEMDVPAVAGLSDEGEEYLADNPSLRNPVDWKWIVSTSIALVSAVSCALAFFALCSKL